MNCNLFKIKLDLLARSNRPIKYHKSTHDNFSLVLFKICVSELRGLSDNNLVNTPVKLSYLNKNLKMTFPVFRI